MSLKVLLISLSAVTFMGSAQSLLIAAPLNLDISSIRESSVAVKSISIEDIRKKAIENNLQIKIANIDPRISAEQLRKENAKFDNTIFVYAKKYSKDLPYSSGDTVKLNSDNKALDGSIVKLNNVEQIKEGYDLEAGLKIPLRSGGSFTVAAPLSYYENNISTSQYSSAAKFSASIPLLRNAGTAVNQVSIKIAELDLKATELKTKLQAIRIVTSVDKAYWDLYEAWGVLDIRKSQFDLSSKNLEMVKKRIKEGLSAPIEENRAAVGVADRIEALVIAKTNLTLAQRQLDFILNDVKTADSKNYPVMSTESSPNLSRFEFNVDEVIKTGSANRLEILEQELKLAADLIKIGYLENQTLPSFSFEYQYGALGAPSDNFNSSRSALFNGNYSDWYIGLKFEMPVTNEARKAELSSALLQRLQRLSSKELQELSVKKEILDSIDKVSQNWDRINIAKEQVIVAAINYDAELKQFKEGLRTMTEVLESLSKLGDAQQKELKAIKDYQIAIIDYSFATGTALEFGKINSK